MDKIVIILMVMSLVDLTASYFYASTFHNMFPTKDYTQLEANPILSNSWKLWGLNKGMIIGGLAVFILLTIVAMSVPRDTKIYLTGVFTMMIIYHFLNFRLLAGLKPAG